ncbi:target of EGR1 protein 1-like [Mizuhopecten yessoensis]|uniref:Target of EGR1 protein 1 n=1 Tax=Mizuhopecten yessoensis TaxID=6573 RepID=A0A210PR78_MIZYE|nr:target of EGR1 protein 1-like [Mizuhopecten yessoensis]OWF38964.1 Target of EGR1 protein 1 [Mizuhopecten yessoensis]
MTMFETVPVVDVHKENFKEIWPSLLLSIKTSTFIAMDTELSGLGNRKSLVAKSIEDRYKGIATSAKSRSILSIGISCYKLVEVTNSLNKECTDSSEEAQGLPQGGVGPGGCRWKFLVQTYNITTLCEEDYVVEPASLKFLVEHGFDFNRQYAKGVPYCRGNDKVDSKTDTMSLRQLFMEILGAACPIIFHNALMDLVFLYENLYASTPPNMAAFLADLTEMFPAGIYDTKYITDFKHKMPASYLEYVFRKCLRTNKESSLGCKEHAWVEFPTYPAGFSHITRCNCVRPGAAIPSHINKDTQDRLKATVCGSYAGHGWCSRGNSCAKSHDVDLILDIDFLAQSKKSRKRKRRRDNNPKTDNESGGLTEPEEEQEMETTIADMSIVAKEESEVCEKDSLKSSENGAVILPGAVGVGKGPVVSGKHRAGFDAFMTGYIMASYVSEYGTYKGSLKMEDVGLEEIQNLVYLTGKDIALSVVKSGFAKTSKDHREKLSKYC